MSVLYDPEQSTHWLQVIIRGIACQQLNDQAAHRPNVRGRSNLSHLYHLQRHIIGVLGARACSLQCGVRLLLPTRSSAACLMKVSRCHATMLHTKINKKGVTSEETVNNTAELYCSAFLCCSPVTHAAYLWRHPVGCPYNILMQFIIVLLFKFTQLGCNTKVCKLDKTLQESTDTGKTL